VKNLRSALPSCSAVNESRETRRRSWKRYLFQDLRYSSFLLRWVSIGSFYSSPLRRMFRRLLPSGSSVLHLYLKLFLPFTFPPVPNPSYPSSIRLFFPFFYLPVLPRSSKLVFEGASFLVLHSTPVSPDCSWEALL